jgi:hypothetical protein
MKRSTEKRKKSELSWLPTIRAASPLARRQSLSASASPMPARLAIQGRIFGAFMLFMLFLLLLQAVSHPLRACLVSRLLCNAT